MSFSSGVKAELCRIGLDRLCCAKAEAYGALLYCNTFSAHEVRIITESPDFAARLPLLIDRAFGLAFDRLPSPEEQKYIFQMTDTGKIGRMIDAFGFDSRQSPVLHINFGLLEENCCRAAFLRGAFLAGGSVTEPAKRYHLELATSHAQASRELLALLTDMGSQPKQTGRGGCRVTYFKSSGQIEDLLTLMGAPLSAMELMNTRAEKELRNGVNRRVNCEAANVGKTVDAALEQRRAIRVLRQAGVLETLSPKLQEAAALREENPELSLAQLAELCSPPVTKSSLSHRLRKLITLSQELA